MLGQKQISENRKNISPVIETIILCGQQSIALRGHVDFGKIFIGKTNEYDRNFYNLLIIML